MLSERGGTRLYSGIDPTLITQPIIKLIKKIREWLNRNDTALGTDDPNAVSRLDSAVTKSDVDAGFGVDAPAFEVDVTKAIDMALNISRRGRLKNFEIKHLHHILYPNQEPTLSSLQELRQQIETRAKTKGAETH